MIKINTISSLHSGSNVAQPYIVKELLLPNENGLRVVQ